MTTRYQLGNLYANGVITRQYSRTWSPWQPNPLFLRFTPELTFSRFFGESDALDVFSSYSGFYGDVTHTLWYL